MLGALKPKLFTPIWGDMTCMNSLWLILAMGGAVVGSVSCETDTTCRGDCM